MQKALGFALVLSLVALTACSKPPQPPALQGSWSDPSTLGESCGTYPNEVVTLDLTQEGTTLGGTFTLQDGYGTGADAVGPFEGSVTTTGQMTGQTTISNATDGSGPNYTFDATGTYDAETGVLATTFVSRETITCGDGTIVNITLEADLTR